MTRSTAAIVAALVVVTAGVAGGIWLALRPDAKPVALTPAAYLARASEVCRAYADRLARIAPPASLTSFVEVETTVGKALPLFEEQAAAVRKVAAPPSLARRVQKLLELVDRSNAFLRRALSAARKHERRQLGLAYGAWLVASSDSHEAASKLGIRCS